MTAPELPSASEGPVTAVLYLVSCYCHKTSHDRPVCLFMEEALAILFARRQVTRWCRDWIEPDSDARWRPHMPADEARSVVPIFRDVCFYVTPVAVARDAHLVLTAVKNRDAGDPGRDTPIFIHTQLPGRTSQILDREAAQRAARGTILMARLEEEDDDTIRRFRALELE